MIFHAAGSLFPFDQRLAVLYLVCCPSERRQVLSACLSFSLFAFSTTAVTEDPSDKAEAEDDDRLSCPFLARWLINTLRTGTELTVVFFRGHRAGSLSDASKRELKLFARCAVLMSKNMPLAGPGAAVTCLTG